VLRNIDTVKLIYVKAGGKEKAGVPYINFELPKYLRFEMRN